MADVQDINRSADQMAFDFPKSPDAASGDAIEAWQAERRTAIESLARKQGLPLGRQVRIDFWNGPSLEGLLVLDEEKLFVDPRRDPSLHLRIGPADFHANEIAVSDILKASDQTAVEGNPRETGNCFPEGGHSCPPTRARQECRTSEELSAHPFSRQVRMSAPAPPWIEKTGILSANRTDQRE